MVEGAMSTDIRPVMFRTAAVADQNIGHRQVKHHVQECEAHQNSERPDRTMVRPGDAAGDRSGGNEQEPEPLRKVLLPPQVFIAATQAFSRRFGLAVDRLGKGAAPTAG